MFSTRHSEGVALMIRRAFSFNGTKELQVVPGRQTASWLKAPVCAVMTGSFSRATLQYTTPTWQRTCSRRITSLFWTILSVPPTEIPLRIFRDGWQRKFTKNRRQLPTVDALHEAIFTSWSNVSTSFIATLASRMSERIFKVINKNSEAARSRVLFWHF